MSVHFKYSSPRLLSPRLISPPAYFIPVIKNCFISLKPCLISPIFKQHILLDLGEKNVTTHTYFVLLSTVSHFITLLT